MAKVMVSIRGPEQAPSTGDVRRRYGLREDEIDTSFGVVEVDPEQHIYTVLVEETAAAKIQPDEGWQVEGPFSNPRIQPFGPPEE
jgi:hypothetical protein